MIFKIDAMTLFNISYNNLSVIYAIVRRFRWSRVSWLSKNIEAELIGKWNNRTPCLHFVYHKRISHSPQQAIWGLIPRQHFLRLDLIMQWIMHPNVHRPSPLGRREQKRWPMRGRAGKEGRENRWFSRRNGRNYIFIKMIVGPAVYTWKRVVTKILYI